jgi:hypothetical protein
MILAITYIVILLYSTSDVCAEEKPGGIALKAVGRIQRIGDNTRIGTGFVAGDTRGIFLPSHVAVSDTLMFTPYKSEYSFRIVVKYFLDQYDLAVYSRTAGSQQETYSWGDFGSLQPGDDVVYLGWDSNDTLGIHTSKVSAKGTMLYKGELVDFVEFEGHAVPGYSGGPVFTTDAKVVAMIVQGWDRKPLHGDGSVRVMRACSVDLLRVLEQRVRTETGADSATSPSDMRLLDVVGGK